MTMIVVPLLFLQGEKLLQAAICRTRGLVYQGQGVCPHHSNGSHQCTTEGQPYNKVLMKIVMSPSCFCQEENFCKLLFVGQVPWSTKVKVPAPIILKVHTKVILFLNKLFDKTIFPNTLHKSKKMDY